MACFQCFDTEYVHHISPCKKYIYFLCQSNMFMVTTKNNDFIPSIICDYCLKKNLGIYFFISDIYARNKSHLKKLDPVILLDPSIVEYL